MAGHWRAAVLFFNSFMVLGTIFVVDTPTALQHEVINSRDTGGNTTSNNGCKVCLGLGAVRYNLLHSSLRWTSAILSLPIGYLVDRLGNGRSAILLASLQFVGAFLFAVSAVSHTPVTMGLYVVMIIGRIFLAFGETPLCCSLPGFGLRYVHIRILYLYSEYILLRYGFPATTSSYITGCAILPFVVGPLVAIALSKMDCIGVLVTCAAAVIVPIFAMLGFTPSIHPLILTISFGLANIVTELGMWQVAVLLVPRSCFGTVTGILYFVRNVVVGLTLLLDGYLLQKYDIQGTRHPLQGYHDFFLALITLTSLSVLCGILLNVLDIRDTCDINGRIGRWTQKPEENIKLLKTSPDIPVNVPPPDGEH
ncbi:uncharacterized protein [Argopecten irradians]|uniref:uncharacterized protein n=1 Tax=Argopecten irradians TaxID=31199 RepID=UPI003718B62A